MKSIILTALVAAAAIIPDRASAMPEPVNLRIEYLEEPIGLDVEKPRFYWQMSDDRRGARQTAYHILVATSVDLLAEDKADVWDSGKVESDQSVHIVYGGPALEPHSRYFWTVRLWDQDDKPASPAKPASWETGLLRQDNWKAQWVGFPYDHEESTVSLAGMKWIWFPEGDPIKKAPKGTRYFRKTFTLPADKTVDNAAFYGIADNSFSAYINGAAAAAGGGWQSLAEVNVSDHLTTGENTLAVSATNSGEDPAGLALLLNITFTDGAEQKVTTGEGWQSAIAEHQHWTTSPETLSDWKEAKVLAELGTDPWGMPKTSSPGGPAAYLRKDFDLSKPVTSARVYVTALGSYRLFFNGERVGNDVFTPDWTDYRKRVPYQTYDVTAHLKQGDNAVGALLGDGWYGSGLGWELARFSFGPPPLRLLAQLNVVYEDGTSETIVTDGSWKWSRSPILRSEIYAGETYDARREQDGWNATGFDDTDWKPAPIVETSSDIAISAQSSAPIRVTETLKPIEITTPSEGVYIYDMGQNMVGWVRLKATAPAGTKVRLRFAEILKPDGHIYRDNLRRAEATDTYYTRGDGEEIFEPHFTYHGFRFVELTGLPNKPDLDTITGIVTHTDAPRTGRLETDNALANKIWLNTLWGLRGNLYSVPTDCPQRDERLGWMGDAQAFWRTACYNMDVAAFTHKWMRDVVDAQGKDGDFSDVSPRIIATNTGAPGWGDAGIIVPYETFKQYGDTRLVEENWEAMAAWIRYLQDANPDLLWKNKRGNDYGDWVPADSETPKDLIATAYWAYDCQLMAEMAQAIGRTAEAEFYHKMFGGIRNAFQKEFIKEDGKIGNGSQTCYVLALHFNLVPEEKKAAAVKHLVDDIMIARKGHLSTGFLGTTYLLPVLSNHGHNDVAYKLLLNEDYPSWGYMVRNGATAIWERWNGDTGDPAMNSYNHFCYGAVSEWMYRHLAGIDTDKQGAGFKRFVIRPRLDERINRANGAYDSVYGEIVSNWERKPNGTVNMEVKIPANTSALVHVPTADRDKVKEGGKSPDEATVKFVRQENGAAVYEVGAGSYSFTVTK